MNATTITRLTVTAGLLIALPLGVAGTANAKPGIFDPGTVGPVITEPEPPKPPKPPFNPCKVIDCGNVPVLDPVVDPGPDPVSPPTADPTPPAGDPAPTTGGGTTGNGTGGNGTPRPATVVIGGQAVDPTTRTVDPATGLPIDLTGLEESDTGGGFGLFPLALCGALIGGAAGGAAYFLSRRRTPAQAPNQQYPGYQNNQY